MRLPLAVLFAALAFAPLAAQQSEGPKDMVLLTVAGAIGNTNREPSDAKRDEFLAFHEISFVKAFAFDRPMLEALPQGTITMQPPETARPATYKGPLLQQVLAAVAARPGRVVVRAIDGYATELTPKQIEESDWTLALTTDGKPLGLGQQGPIWLLNSPPKDRPATREEMERWAWGVFYIEVEE